ncbi:MAG: DASS family sodium-coupled anion symporter [Armatimonadetes bacterium]|nr:DASS family sodium-coupled anion symporter [Armatimonadota bacterium]
MLATEANRRLRKLSVCMLVASLAFAVPAPDLTYPMRCAAFIFLLSAGLWVSEGIPLFATSLLLVGLEVLLLTKPGTDGYKKYFEAVADPVVVLFFGGFLMARAATRYKLHIALARGMLKLFGSKPRMVLMGLMAVTAAFAMWMSATATTAMMLAITAPLVAQLDDDDPFRKALVLGVAFAASIGGIGTPIGSPPNAVAVGALRRLTPPIEVSVPQWMMVAMPLMLMLMVLTYLLLTFAFKPKTKHIELDEGKDFRLPMTAYVVAAVFGVTVLLWLTGSLHHIPAAVVALVPAVVFTTLCIIDADDVNTLEWNVLILIAGGIALSTGLHSTGLDKWLITHMALDGRSPAVVVAIFGVFMFVISSFMSHTVAVNLLLPVALGVSTVSPLWMGFVLPLISAMSITFPVSTPPNTLAYSTGEVTTADMAKIGGLVAVGSMLLLLLTGHTVLSMYGMLPK